MVCGPAEPTRVSIPCGLDQAFEVVAGGGSAGGIGDGGTGSFGGGGGSAAASAGGFPFGGGGGGDFDGTSPTFELEGFVAGGSLVGVFGIAL